MLSPARCSKVISASRTKVTPAASNAAQRVRGLKHPPGERRAHQLQLVEAGQAGVQVAVEDAGQQPEPVAVQPPLVPGRAQAAADHGHAPVDHADVDRAGEAAAVIQGLHPGDENAGPAGISRAVIGAVGH
jgi:hypothetical protein